MPASQTRWIALTTTLAVAAWCGALLCVPLHDGDLWFHLSGGRMLWERGDVPRVDELTLVRAGAPWIDLHWGFQILAYGAWSAGGAKGLGLFGCALAAAVALATSGAARELLRWHGVEEDRSRLLAPFAALTWVPAFALRPLLRPELLSFALLALLLATLVRFARAGSGRAGSAAVALLVALANVQGLFVLGWLLAAALLAPLLLDRERRRGALLLGALLLAAPLANPYGVSGWLFPWELWTRIDGSAAVFSRIAEFTPALLRNDATAWTFGAFAALIAAGCSLALGTRRFAQAFALGLLGAGALFLAYQARRNLSFVALAAAAALVPLLAVALHRRVALAAGTLLGVLALVLAIDAAGPARAHAFRVVSPSGLGLAPDHFPLVGLERWKRAGEGEALFCDLNVGACASFVLERPALVDARLEVLGRSGLETYFELLADVGFFERTCEHYALRAALIDLRAAHTRVLLAHLASSSAWRAAALDGPWALFVRASWAEARPHFEGQGLGDLAARRRLERAIEGGVKATARESAPRTEPVEAVPRAGTGARSSAPL
ncbi:MAG: hypothetical protein JNM84_16570 [Planctomycetes bacterium]|nr:hypothetical protein [Planctomycetota bacterium]